MFSSSALVAYPCTPMIANNGFTALGIAPLSDLALGIVLLVIGILVAAHTIPIGSPLIRSIVSYSFIVVGGCQLGPIPLLFAMIVGTCIRSGLEAKQRRSR